jgi:hypothetical protein
MICRMSYFQKLTQFSLGNHVLDAPASNTDAFLSRDMCFSNSAEYAYLKQIEPISTLKILISMKYTFQYSQGTMC